MLPHIVQGIIVQDLSQALPTFDIPAPPPAHHSSHTPRKQQEELKVSETLSQADREIVNGKAVIICELEPYLVGLFLFFFF